MNSRASGGRRALRLYGLPARQSGERGDARLGAQIISGHAAEGGPASSPCSPIRFTLYLRRWLTIALWPLWPWVAQDDPHVVAPYIPRVARGPPTRARYSQTIVAA